MNDQAATVFDHLTDRPIAYFPCFARIAGSLTAGVLLAQLLYWHKAVKGREFFKKDLELIKETALTWHEFRAAKSRLKLLKFIQTKRKMSPAVTHYTINKTTIIEAIGRLPKSVNLDCRNPLIRKSKIRQSGLPKSVKPLPTEITTDNILPGKPDPAQEIIQDLNQKSRRQYKHTTKATKVLINARIQEGFTVEDFKVVHDNKIPTWTNDPQMDKYIRPETLYAAKHFESYLNERPPTVGEHNHQETDEERAAKKREFDKAWAKSPAGKFATEAATL